MLPKWSFFYNILDCSHRQSTTKNGRVKVLLYNGKASSDWSIIANFTFSFLRSYIPIYLPGLAANSFPPFELYTIPFYCFLPVQYFNYIFIFQQIALN